MRLKLKISVFALAILVGVAWGQSSNTANMRKMEVKLSQIPALEKKIDISVSEVPIQEFIRGIANLSGLNINIDPTLDLTVSNNFSQARVADIVLYIVDQYDLDFNFVGNILTIKKKEAPVVVEKSEETIEYDSRRNQLTLNFSDQPLPEVMKQITRKTGKNVILTPAVRKEKVSGYVQALPFDVALEKFLYSNKLAFTKDETGVYVVQKQEVVQKKEKPKETDEQGNAGEFAEGLSLELVDGQLLNITAEDVEINDILKSASFILDKDVALISDIKGKMNVFAKAVSYEDLLVILLENTPYDFKVENDIYILGERKSPVFEMVEIYRFQNRVITDIVQTVPAELKKDIEISENAELNSLIISGPENQTRQLIDFLQKIDQSVPVVLIELIIVDVSKTFAVSTGISAGIGEAPAATGQVFPQYDVNLSQNTINNLLASFQTPGTRILGRVGPDFYLQLKAMESQGILNIHSTPRLSTLNSHEATMNIGRTEYYQEQRSNIIGSQNPQVANSIEYKSVEASLNLTIIPVVSGNDQITIDLIVTQSDFTERIAPLAPPGAVNRDFQSMIRVKNEEMILLGGLEQKRTNDTGAGVPFLSRVPVIKWFFSSRDKTDTKSRLSIFIKPTIIN